jgi:hypothetical protein
VARQPCILVPSGTNDEPTMAEKNHRQVRSGMTAAAAAGRRVVIAREKEDRYSRIQDTVAFVLPSELEKIPCSPSKSIGFGQSSTQ